MNFERDPDLKPVNMAFYRECFVSGSHNQDRLDVAYYFRPSDGHLLASVATGKYASGPPGLVHGGAMAALLDEAMGVMAWFNQQPAVTASLTINFAQALPLGQHVMIDAWIDRIDGKKIFTRGEIRSADTCHASADALFIRLPPAAFPEELIPLVKQQYGLDLARQ